MKVVTGEVGYHKVRTADQKGQLTKLVQKQRHEYNGLVVL